LQKIKYISYPGTLLGVKGPVGVFGLNLKGAGLFNFY